MTRAEEVAEMKKLLVVLDKATCLTMEDGFFDRTEAGRKMRQQHLDIIKGASNGAGRSTG